jgi:hypothetical protein
MSTSLSPVTFGVVLVRDGVLRHLEEVELGVVVDVAGGERALVMGMRLPRADARGRRRRSRWRGRSSGLVPSLSVRILSVTLCVPETSWTKVQTHKSVVAMCCW